ncbi:hypothetical protein PTSG_09131 [Salpingoeca rosetta]|uniref:Letm1 RBD domain-containing protein n=1 Tax=Salpingoeca rosetta (strain ATCC 50818 / BSB-021) TaxID=946362 RepID=F2UMT7_SALR5|nr:uncharacterized protein PTSG_09131 [Salpingoeca rosetta]EGD78436.1 hypothetical protein PTSG_09131 [Salpingoeca rosetta]|eukprot:XP_004989385.1 hypothetical protein PTSG_09131 [Salpingoeca rosetta]
MRQGGRAVLRRGGSAAQATRCLHHHRQRHQLMPAALGVSSRIVADSASSLTPATLATTTQRALLHIMNNGSRSGSSSGHSSGDANNTAASALAWTTSPASSDNNTNDDARRLLGDGGDTGLNFELRSPLLMARRPFHVATPSLEAAKLIADESKVEQKVKRLLTQKLKEQKNPAYNLIIDKRAMEDADKKAKAAAKKAPIYKRIWTKQFWTDMYRAAVREAQHYKAGFQLLWTDIRLSFRYLRRVLNGEQLSRRERKQFVRTAGDIFRLVPFSAFIIVPGMELLLPFAIKFFPGMLPSQFQETKTKLARQKAELRVKLDMAKFLQATLEDMALSKGKGSTKHTSLAAEFTKFLEENRKAGYVPASAILKYAPLFKDNLTLDTLDAPQLRALCKLLNVPSIGSIAMLRFQLRTRLRALHADDLIIAKEGVGSLTTSELQVLHHAGHGGDGW